MDGLREGGSSTLDHMDDVSGHRHLLRLHSAMLISEIERPYTLRLGAILAAINS
jgi:hypothetical protein